MYTCEVRSSRCCCFRSLDLRADSRLDSFLRFLLLSIWAWRSRSSSDLELRVPKLDPDEVPLDMVMSHHLLCTLNYFSSYLSRIRTPLLLS